MILYQSPCNGNYNFEGCIVGEENMHVAIYKEHDEDREKGGDH